MDGCASPVPRGTMKKIRTYKRGGIWWIDYFAQGKRVRQSTKCGDRKAARRFADAIETASAVPTFAQAVEVLRMIYGETPAHATPLSSAWEVYERLAKATGKATENMARRKNVLDRFIRWIAANRPRVETVESVDGPVAAAFASALAAQGIKTKTRANILGELGTIWRLMEKGSADVHNPWGGLMPRITDAQRGEAFTPVQESAVLAAAEKVGKDWLPICQIMRLTGLRYSDVARLTWEEVGADAITLKPHKTQRHGIAVTLPLIPQLRAVLAGIERRGECLFPLHAGLYGNRGRAAREALNFREVLDAAGVSGKGYTIHSWRHTAATRLAEAGVGIETRKRILGHTEDATAERYDHAAHYAEVAAAMEGAARVGQSAAAAGDASGVASAAPSAAPSAPPASASGSISTARR